MEKKVLLSIRNITKVFPGVKAIDQVSLDVKKGEVHALVGENGAGKSTLVNIISGVLKPDGGELIFDDQPYARPTRAGPSKRDWFSPSGNGTLSPSFGCRNVFLGRMPYKAGGLVDFKRLGWIRKSCCRIFRRI